MSEIIIAPYDAKWPELYLQERDKIAAALGETVCGIEHVGSTAVPGLGAKPIVDIMVGLVNEQLLDGSVAPLEGIGYTYAARYEREMPFRRFFFKKPLSAQAYNLHVVPYGHEFWIDHLLFRDHLRSNPQAAHEYEEYKRWLAPQFSDTSSYSDAKTAFIRTMLRQAEAAMPRPGK